MGVGQRKLAPLWTLALALACTRHTGHAQDGSSESSYEHHPALSPIAQGPGGVPPRGVTLFPPLRTIPVVRASNPAHNGRVCSTWGDFHYKTFDGDVFRFPGLCNYVFSEHCGAAYEDFNVQLRRSQESAAPTLSRVLMKVDGVVIQLTNGSVLVNGRPVLLPFSQSGVFIQQSSSYTKVEARLGLVLMWNHDDSLLLELDAKYANKTCGLCGDFNGMPVVSELLSHNIKLTPMEFGNLQKMDDPTEQCEDPVPEPPRNCSTGSGICEELLNGQLFSSCVALVDVGSYLEACRQDLCFCGGTDLLSCVCHTLAEYSRQCAHAGGLPQDWRGPDLCPQTCPSNMQYHECRSPCTDTCSNQEHSQACEDHCVAGCFCPEGTVLDDVGQTGCVPVSQCACVYNGTAYAPGATYSTDCTNCTCSGGRWSCQEVPCPGTCSVLGGAHFSTFDERHYTVHGDCGYVLTKPCDSSAFTVLAELRRCGLTDSETCLKSVTLSLDGAQTVVVIKASGEVFLNQIYTQLPISAANVTIFRPSTFFIIAQTNLGLQLDLQLVPTMQLFVRLAPKLRGQTCGLCGNFNSIQADDFRTLSGVVEATAAAFFNTFKTQAACPNIRNSFEDPCSLSVENEKYAQHWCSQLTDANGPFSRCHAAVKPDTYYSNCMFDTCNCERSEDCLCAVLSSYVHACAAKGVQLSGWRNGVCTKPMTTCPKSMTYHYNVSTCQPTCRSLSEGDITCSVGFIPVDGCICPEGTFLDDTGKCVQASNCPCYHRGSVIPNGESVHDSGAVCTCTHGKLSCIGGQAPTPVCAAPMVFFDCHNATPGDTGAGCQKSCHTLDMTCYSPQCVPGCVCPDGLVADGEGNCITVEDCPCVHNEASYRAGQTIRVGCNTCTCDSRMWRCTDDPCLATCAVYGDGHYLTFDGQSYSFNGDCEYMLVQNHCGGKGSAQDSFRVVTENVPCGTTGTTCSKAIKIFLGGSELKLSHGKVEVIGTNESQEVPYTIRQMGIYLVVDTDIGLVLLWDKKTSIFINLSPEFKSRVCGLCGNFDDIAANDFATRSQSVVGDVLEFGNSWKLSPSCPDALAAKDPCTANPFRKSWAQKQCSLLHGPTFTACHAHVEPARYYEACVNDACACDSGGDCECFCTAVAAYAQACHEAGLCVSWRTPSICPLFCDYYNPEGQCEWHYQPCGAPCLRTCRNPRGDCLQDVRGLEGCYPKCPPEAPIFDEDKMQCVATCPTPPPPPLCHVHGKSYRPGAVVPSDKNCHSCLCTERGVECTYEAEACVCTYDGQRFHPGDVIYHTTDGTGGCISARCGANGTIERRVYPCSPTTPVPPTTFSFSTPPLVVSSTHASSPVPSSMHTGPPSSAWPTTAGISPRTKPPTASASLPPVCGEECLWSPWMDVSRPGRGMDSGDFDTLKNLRAHGYLVCESPRSVECRAEDAPRVPLRALGQRVQCSPDMGLTCRNREQASGLCYNYQIRVLCCTPLACSTSSSSTQTTPPTTSKTTETRASASSVPSSTPGPVSLSTSRATPAPGTATSVKRTFSTPSPPPVPATSTSSVSTTAPGTSVVSSKPSHTESITPSCVHELCTWTEWIDGSYPDPGINGGDFDTFQNLRDEGYKFCENPQSVECRAVGFPNTPLADLGQDVICSRTEGLICLNKNQLPPICYNYEIRIQCCKTVNKCRDGTRTLKTITTTRPTPHPAGAQTQTTFTTHVPSASTEQPTATSRGGSTATSVTQDTHNRSVTRDCHPQCTWTKWFDVDFPSPGPHGGDEETYNNIMRSGEKICRQPEEITRLQCRAASHPEVSIEHLGQVVQCSREEGLVCRNQDQQGPFKMCLNYEVRVLCCETPKGCPVMSTPVTAPSTPSGRATSPTQSTSSWQKPRTTTLVTISTTSTPQTSTISTPTTNMTSAPTPRTTSAPTTSTTSAPTTSTSSAPTTSTTSAPTSSTTSAPTTSTTSAPTTSTTSAPTTSTTSAPTTSTTSAPTSSTTSTAQSSTTSAPIISTTSAPTTSTTSAPTTSTPSSPGTTPSPVPTTSTTSVSKTSTSHVSVSKTTHPQPVTSDCHPQCTWTKWFDVDFPSPGPHGGDEETYNNIIRSGEKICRQPEEITRLQCRAASHPEVSIEHLGQVVQCSREEGLVCRNQDQQGPFKMCLNYEVRVLCCEIPKGCPVTAVTPYGTSTNTLYPSLSTSVASTSVASGSVASSSVASSSVAYSTPTCFCNVTDRLYPMGSTIYRHRDLAGHCYYALCSQDCQVVRGVGSDCPSTTLPPAPATSPWTSTSEPVTELGCPNAVPPRKKGETWATPNCSEATCEGNNIISLRPRTCPRVEKPTCANGYPALKVADQDGCCYHYQCQCVCSGWGDPHYITFDGTYYTFLDNCTYVLVQQIVPVYGHFRVLVDNDFCGAEDGLSCPKSIILEYQQDRVVLTRKSVHGAMTNEIIFNNKVVSPGFRKNGIVVSRVGIKMYATIPALGVQVMFSGLIFSVEVPFSKFANNTEGQCGTCTNDLKDECRTPGGTVVASCSEMSGLWNVSIPNQPACHGPRPLPTTVGPTTVGSTTFGPTTPPAPCPPSSICRLILSKVFEPCHAVIPPLPFYEGCTFDQCHKTDLDTVCSSLELYAALCASQDICIDWRGRTNHMCPFTCPADKVYQPCGPSNPSYCYGNDSASLGALPEAGPITEGCFCPEGMTFFSTSAQVCVPTGCPRCLGPHGEPVKVGHTVGRDCQECTCEAATWTLTCRPKLCPLPPACPLPGFVPVPAAPQAGQCCPQYNCACNTSHCPAPVDCPEGARAIPTYKEGDCCPVQKCNWTECSINGTLYQPGAVVSSSLCETCRCELPGGPLSDTFVVSCETQICNSHCPVGFEYQEQSGQCCGTCVQVACVTNTSGSSTHLFYPGETWSDPGNHCVTYECEKHLDGLVVVTTKKACPPLSCSLDEARMSKDGCCRFCPPPPLPPQYQNQSTCAVYHRSQIIQQQGCNSSEPVRLAYCRGNCGDSSSMYSFEGNMVEHRCQCCQELRTSLRNVTLHCADGSSRTFSFTEVEQCGCRGQRCPTPGDTQHSEEMGPEQSQEAGSGSWERGTLVSPVH
ncbi:PREDICTED: mucin-5AC [Cercocebus atys]|uniref:mucin-5AC n=1 Tax=Cercocebus atys TaxID=9531 RepID=UPI0005F50D5D|nr:PREDICTED: mucin-5AC [Cercocebus atys]